MLKCIIICIVFKFCLFQYIMFLYQMLLPLFFFTVLVGFYGTSDWEAAQIDMIVDCMEDTIHHMFAFFFSHDTDEAKVTNVNLEMQFA